MKVLVAGGTGVVGKPLVARLRAAGHEALSLGRKQGDVLCDALDAAAVRRVVGEVRPDVIVHQLTAIPQALSPKRIDRDFAATNVLRREGTKNLIAAAKEAGVKRFVAQSVAFLAPPTSDRPATEDEPIWADGSYAPELGGALLSLEQQVTSAGFDQALVCRYGLFWGPGTSWDRNGAMTVGLRARKIPIVGKGSGRFAMVHVDDAAAATQYLLERGTSGVVNISEDEAPTTAEALRTIAAKLGAKPPFKVWKWLARLGAGRYGVFMMTAMRAASNERARALGWSPTRSFLRDYSGSQ